MEEQTSTLENTSGVGKNSQVPESVSKKYNWGAFLISSIWSIRYKPIMLLLLLPISCLCKFVANKGMFSLFILFSIIQLALFIYVGKKGNQWAWQRYHYKSEEEFHKLQQRWVKVCVGILLVIPAIGVIAAMTIPTLLGNAIETERLTAEKTISTDINKILETSESMPGTNGTALANAFSKRIKIKQSKENVFEDINGNVWAFSGNGKSVCKFDYTNIENNCTVTVDTNGLDKAPNMVGTLEHPKDRWRYIIGEKSAINAELFNKQLK